VTDDPADSVAADPEDDAAAVPADDAAQDAGHDDRGWFLHRAVSGAVDATMGRVEDRVAATTRGVIDDVEPYLVQETVPRIIDALLPHLIERVVPEVIDGLTQRLAAETGPAIVDGMTPQLADELVPVLLERMRPYLESELVPAIVDGLTPHIIEQTAPRVIDGVLPYIRAEIIPVVMDDFVEDPRVRDLIREQSLGLLWDGLEVLRRGLARADDVVERVVRTITFSGEAIEGLPADELLPGRDRSHAGIVTRSAALTIDFTLVSLIAAQLLATTIALIGAVIDPVPNWAIAVLTFSFAMLGPLYLTIAWRATTFSLGGAIAGFRDVRADGQRLGVIRAFIRALTTLFLIPLWALGLIGTVFHPLRRSWVDRVLGARTPYVVHMERRTRRLRG
jgi:uncharacterized RDD family membrane protein YckC